jgi:hypothetical protein
MLRVIGQVAIDSPPITELAAGSDPTLFYLNALRATLERHRILVGGNTLDIDDQRVKPDYSRATLVLEDQSPTLDSVIDVCLKWSRKRVRGNDAAIACAPRRRGHGRSGPRRRQRDAANWA